MKQSSVVFALLGAVGLAGVLSACGDGSPSASASAGGASGSGSASASGTVTGFGSLFVSEKKFETENVEVRHDGITERCTITANVNDRCGLKEGMKVTVSGSFSGSTHRASTIVQEDTLEGPITSKAQVDANNGTLTVLGQTVVVDETTKFDDSPPLTLTSLAIGDVVEVSGFVKSDGVIGASFIERKSGVVGCTAVCEIKGVAKLHSHNSGTGSGTFQIGGLTIAYDNTTIIDNSMPAPTGNNWTGIFVEVKGTSLAGGTLTATKVERENEGVGNVVDEFEVEGFVTQAGAPNGNVILFTIGTTQVQTTANTEFRGGLVDEIVVGAKMSAEGRFDGTTLIAKHVKFKESARVEGDVVDIVSGGAGVEQFKLAGLPNVTITVNGQTEFKDTTRLTLANTNHVRVRGRVTGPTSGTIIATRVELRSADDDVDLQGPVQSINGQTLVILNTSVDTSGLQNDDFEGLNDQIIGRAAFFNAVTVGTLVKVQGRLVGGTVTWREVELED